MHLQRAFEAAVDLHVQLLLLPEGCEAKTVFQRPGTAPEPPIPKLERRASGGRFYSPDAKVFFVKFPRVVWKNPYDDTDTPEEKEELRVMCEGKFRLHEEYEPDNPGEDGGGADPTEKSSAQREAQARRQEEERQHGDKGDEDELHQTEQHHPEGGPPAQKRWTSLTK